MRETLPTFSIIIPTYGRPQQLLTCLQSIAKLDYPRDRFEAIIVDDGNVTPIDAPAVDCCDQVAWTVIRQEHTGPAAARNTGARQAKGRFLAFTDDDCTPSADWLRALAARMAVEPDGVIGGRTVNLLIDNVHSTASQMLVSYLYTYYNSDPAHARFLTSNNLALPTDLFRAVGGFDPSFMRTAGEDRELCDRLRHHGHRMRYAPEAIVYHAHELTLGTFLRQHFRYGRGAHQFHRARAERTAGRLRIEPPRFYVGIVRYPLRRPQGVGASSLLAGLMMLSQAANAAGYVWEGVREAVAEDQSG